MSENIIKKIKNLMELAQDNPSDAEGQSALLMAQKLMLKHDIHLAQVEAHDKPEKFETGEAIGRSASALRWWEKDMAVVISTNFRCYVFQERDRITETSYIIFFGEKKDAEMAAKVYDAALMYLRYRIKRLPDKSPAYKNSYIRGFIFSLSNRFKKQVEEYGLMVLPKKEVLEDFHDRFQNLGKDKTKRPNHDFDREAFEEGKSHGENAKIMPDEILGEEE